MSDNANLLIGEAGGGTDGTGLAWFAPLGTTAPTDATSALNAAFLNAGGISEDGLTGSFSEDSNQIRFYGSRAVQRQVVTSQESTFNFRFMEHNEVSLAVYHRKALGSIVPAVSTGAFSLTTGTFNSQRYSAVFQVVDSNGVIRLYLPSCEVSNRGDIQIQAGEPISYEVTLTTYPVNGVNIQWFYAIPNLG